MSLEEAITTAVRDVAEREIAAAVAGALTDVGLDPGRRRVLTVAEVGEALGIGRSAAYRLVKSDAIHTIRIANRIYVPVWALDAFVGEQPDQLKHRAPCGICGQAGVATIWRYEDPTLAPTHLCKRRSCHETYIGRLAEAEMLT